MADRPGLLITEHTPLVGIREAVAGASVARRGLRSGPLVLLRSLTPDLIAPYLALENPAPSATDISRYTNILLDVLDADTGVNLATVRIWVEGVLAYRGDTDTFLPPFNGSLSARSIVSQGHHFVIDSTVRYAEYTVILVEVDAYDLAVIPNLLSTGYSFRTVDEAAPYLTGQAPPPAQTDVLRNTNITLDLLDDGAGVDAVTVWIKVNGVYAWLSGVAQPGFSATKTTITGGYRYVIDPGIDFASYQTVTVAVYADDLNIVPNTLNTSYIFRTVDVVAPYAVYKHPTQGDTGVPVWHPVYLDLVDDGSGVVAASVVITVAGVIAWQGDTAQPGFVGSTKTPISGGFSYTIQQTMPYLVSSPILVGVTCEDVSGNIFTTSYTFNTETGATPQIFDVVPTANQTYVAATTALSFNVTDAALDLNPASVLCIINDIVAYQNQVQQNGYTVSRTVIPGGYAYTVTPPTPYIWGSPVSVFLFAQDYSLAHTDVTFTFDISPSPGCFSGPLNAFEEKIVQPFSDTLKNLESLRYSLIQNFVPMDPVVASRAVFLQGQTHELAVVLRNLVPIPTALERGSLLCKRRTLLTVARMMPDKRSWLENSVEELTGLGAPLEHRQLIRTYVDAADEAQVIVLACFVILFAKALE